MAKMTGEMLGKFGVCKSWLKRKSLSKTNKAADACTRQDVSESFWKYLCSKYQEVTARQYLQVFKKLSAMHKKDPEVMASAKYLESVRKMSMPLKYAVTVRAFGEFWSEKAVKTAGLGESVSGVRDSSFVDGHEVLPRGHKHMQALFHVQDASAQDRESFPGLAKLFEEYLHDKYPPQTAQMYGNRFRRMFKLHGKAPHEMASENYLEAIRKMNLPFVYAAVIQAFCRFKGVIVGTASSKMRERANEEARKLFKIAQEQGRRVSDADVLAVLRLFPFPENTFRKNVLPKGVKFVHSATLGLIADRRGRKCISSITLSSDGVVRLLREWLDGQLGTDPFPFTSININKNYAAALHRDRNNCGPSAIRSLGNFQDGQLRYWPDVPRNAELTSLKESDCVVMDPRHGVVIFDGNNPHSVKPYAGEERFSIVFFTLGNYRNAKDNTRIQLGRLGMKWPSNKSLASASRLAIGSQ